MKDMSKKVAYYGCILSLAMIFSYVEFLVPFNLGIPGIKLGLANIIAVLVLYKNGFKSSMVINIARVLLVGIIFGNIFSIIYSLSGGILSVAAMALAKKWRALSPVGVSVIGATAHNIGQIAAAAIVLETAAVFYYLPFLIISAVVTGVLIGLSTTIIISRLKSANI